MQRVALSVYMVNRGSSATKYARYKSKNAENTPSANARRRQLVVSVCATHSSSYIPIYTAAVCKAVVHKVNMHHCATSSTTGGHSVAAGLLTLLLRYATLVYHN